MDHSTFGDGSQPPTNTPPSMPTLSNPWAYVPSPTILWRLPGRTTRSFVGWINHWQLQVLSATRATPRFAAPTMASLARQLPTRPRSLSPWATTTLRQLTPISINVVTVIEHFEDPPPIPTTHAILMAIVNDFRL